MSKYEDRLLTELRELIGEEILVVTQATQLNILGQAFRPVFVGTITDVQEGHITLSPVIIKMVNAPFYESPFPLSFPLEEIVAFSTEVSSDMVIPLT
jgi:hypothetical protein